MEATDLEGRKEKSFILCKTLHVHRIERNLDIMTLKSNLQKSNIVSPNHSLMMIDLKTLCVMHFDNI